MNKILLVGSIKGGVGKTTSVVHLASFLISVGVNVCILKADKNPELSDWSEKRSTAGLKKIPLEIAFGDISQRAKGLKEIYEIVIIDCAGHDSLEFRSALTVADILLTLVKPSSEFETGTLTRLTETVRSPKINNPNIEAFVLMNRVKSNKISIAVQLESILRSDPIWIQPLHTRFSELDIYESAANLGAGCHDVERGSSLGKAKAQIELVIKELGLY